MRPSIADGRNLLNSVTGKYEWSPMVTLSDIVLKLPVFIHKAFQDPLCGSFTLGDTYDLSFWSSGEYFVTQVKEVYNSPDRTSSECTAVLTDDIFLLLEPKSEDEKSGVLVAWGFLESLVMAEVVGKSFVSLSWRARDDSKRLWKQTFEVAEGEKLTAAILERMKKLDNISVKEGKKVMLNEEEVTMKSVAKLDINEINENIAFCESSLESDPSLSKLQTLTLLYQKVNPSITVGHCILLRYRRSSTQIVCEEVAGVDAVEAGGVAICRKPGQ
eukprot:TRINITY_DN957_c0_g1_i11.p1 TRINITY_DN957_c0_g1~~TRINITY_DN957_c0_g1_i11.p1  ORF type:complete len:273 (-),score=48.68 TRINITY_DN957_c0_g1_i11:207-1025(-)